MMVSSVGHVQAEVRALDAGAEDFLRKPVEPTLLVSRVRRVLLRSNFSGVEAGTAQEPAA